MENTKSKSKYPMTKANFKTFRMLSIAVSQYGKSYSIAHFIQDLFDKKIISPSRFILFSPTALTDDSMKPLIKFSIQKYGQEWLESNYREFVDEELLYNLYHNQKKIKELGKKPKEYLVLMDDCLGDKALTDKKGFMNVFAMSSRHYHISSICLLQAYRSTLSSVVRNQMSIIMIGMINNRSSLEDLLEEFSQGPREESAKEAKKRMIEQWQDCTSTNDNHGFLVVYPYQHYGQGRIQCNLDGPFIDKQQMK